MNREKYILLKTLETADILKKLKEFNVIIAGGAITSVFTDNKINDYDLYFRNLSDFLKTKDFFDNNENFKYITSTDNAITYKIKSDKINLILQLIKLDSLFKEPAEIIKEFDFTICQGAFDLKNDLFILSDYFIRHNSQRRLIVNIDGKFPIATAYRMVKYLNKGYKISGGEVMKLSLMINRLHMETYKDLKEQLQGIDTLAFKDLTDKLMSQEYAEKKYEFEEFMHIIDGYLEEKAVLE